MFDVQRLIVQTFKDENEQDILEAVEGASRLLQHHVWKTNLRLIELLAAPVSQERLVATNLLLDNIRRNEETIAAIEEIRRSYADLLQEMNRRVTHVLRTPE